MLSKTKTYLCKTCSNKAATQNGSPACAYHKCLINPEEDFCSWHASLNDSYTCPLCRMPKKSKDFYIYLFDDKNVLICKDCSPHMNTCNICAYGQICGFMNDHSEPSYITKTVQQGMMMMQTQVKNPKLIVKHCQKCKCSDGADPSIKDVTCFKEQGGTICPNWQIRPELLQ